MQAQLSLVVFLSSGHVMNQIYVKEIFVLVTLKNEF